MVIVQVTDEVRKTLRNSNFSPLFLDNCLNSRFLAVEFNNQEIIGACFVGGLLNSNGIEINEEFRGKGLGKKLLSEILEECQKRKISFLVGVFKPTNAISIKTHMKIGYQPLFTFHYNKMEGKEIVVILPFNKKGHLLTSLLRLFDTRIGNIFFAILMSVLRSFLKGLISFSSDQMPKIDFLYSVKNFEKVQKTLEDIHVIA